MNKGSGIPKDTEKQLPVREEKNKRERCPEIRQKLGVKLSACTFIKGSEMKIDLNLGHRGHQLVKRLYNLCLNQKIFESEGRSSQ